MARVLCLLGAVVLAGSTLAAQTPVEPIADVASYFTAAVNPTVAVIEAIRSDDTKCRLTQLAVAEAIGNTVAFTLQHFIISARPCLGCPANGFPSAHVEQSVLGSMASSKRWGWGVSLAWVLGTAEGRDKAHRHTRAQEAAGFALGALAEGASHALVQCRS